MKPTIVIPVFKKEESLINLLSSINRAVYPGSDIDLVLSLEFNTTDEVCNLADQFHFKAGKKTILRHDEKLGLRKHILKCADLTEEYGSIILLEDDLLVSPDFYNYSSAALKAYGDEDSVAGISLYAQRFNETAQLPFEPMPSSWSVYFMQLGCSWGQAWTKKQWNHFKKWKSDGGIKTEDDEYVPKNILKWSSTTWEVEYNKYLIQSNKFIAYPYKSYSTVCSQYEGEHFKDQMNLFHVPIGVTKNPRINLNFPTFNEQQVKYDAFMECTGSIVTDLTDISHDEVELDLYGEKSKKLLQKKRFAISSKRGGKILQSYPLIYRPPELNMQYKSNESGKDFFFKYKSDEVQKLKRISVFQFIKMTEYFSYQPLHSKFFIKGYSIVIAHYLKRKLKKWIDRSSKSEMD